MTHYGMAIDLSRCIGCHTCAIACKMANNLPKNVLFNRARTSVETEWILRRVNTALTP